LKLGTAVPSTDVINHSNEEIAMMRSKNPIASFAVTCLMLFGLVAYTTPGWAADGKKQGIVLQVSDSNPATWNLVLGMAEKIPTLLGKENVEIEIVTLGPGHQMLKFDSVVGKRLKTVADSGVALRVCGMTMKQNKLSEADLYPDSGIKVVRAGSLEIMEKSQAGWFHIRP
jgi:intracellular sulfur oxidation DsrE/DsrF family protein